MNMVLPLTLPSPVPVTREWLFVLLNKGTGLAGWWLKLRTPDELMDYLELTNSRYARAFQNYGNDSFYGTAVGHGPHPRESALTLAAYLRGVNRGQSIVEAILDLAGETASGMLDSIRERGYVYVNRNGGWNWSGESESGDFARRDRLVWPDYGEADVRISRFPGGRHWYAHVGTTEVSKDGNRRFTTYAEAKAAAAAYLNPTEGST